MCAYLLHFTEPLLLAFIYTVPARLLEQALDLQSQKAKAKECLYSLIAWCALLIDGLTGKMWLWPVA